MEKVRMINYLDEEFAPCDGDDADMCFRARASYGWKCGVYPIDYLSDLRWGTSRIKMCLSHEYAMSKSFTIQRNWGTIDARHRHMFQDRYDENRIVE
jgi:hypothetical protein